MNIFKFSVVVKDFWECLRFLPVTIKLSLEAAVLGLVLGLLIAVIQMKKIKVLNQICVVYNSFMRGTPILIQLYVTYFGIPIALQYINYYYGTNYNIDGMNKLFFAILALGMNTASFNSITIRASLESVDKGQIEAAHSVGLTPIQTLFRIIIPEALEVAIPSLGNSLIGLIKGTSLAFTCAVVEITAQAKIVAGRDYRYFEAYAAIAVIYWSTTLVLELILYLIEKKIHIPDVVGGRQKRRRLLVNDKNRVTE